MPTGTDTVVPTHPSNRSFISMLRAWGIEVEEGGDKWRAKMPDGNNLVVMPPHIHDGNPSAVFTEAYHALDVSAEQFWSGPVADKPTTSPAPTSKQSKPRERYINKVADCLVQFGGPMSTDRIAEELSLTTAQAGSACRQLVQQDVIEQIKSGIYCAKQYAADARLAIDIDVSSERSQSAPSPVREVPALTSLDLPPAPLPPVATEPVPSASGLSEDEVEDLMETVLDLIFPSGMHVRAADLKVIADWIESTKRLMYRVRAVES